MPTGSGTGESQLQQNRLLDGVTRHTVTVLVAYYTQVTKQQACSQIIVMAMHSMLTQLRGSNLLHEAGFVVVLLVEQRSMRSSASR